MTTSSNQQQAVPRLDTPLVQNMVGRSSSGQAVTVDGGNISIPWYRFLISLWNRTGGGSGTSGVASGLMFVWPGDPNALPNGLLPCNGMAVSREQYENLFAAIGTKYGPGDGQTTFNLPNVQNRVLMGASNSKPWGTIGGNNNVVLTEAQLPEITLTVTDPGHAHGQEISAAATSTGVLGTQGANKANDTTIGATASAETGIEISPFGGGQPVDFTPSYLAATWVIQT